MAKVTLTIRIDREVYAALRELSKDFRDTPNRVLRRVLKLDEGMSREELLLRTIAAASEDADD